MKLQDSDIISAARDLRDKQNERLIVAPNPLKGRHTATPLWWGAIAAALVIGFFIGKGSPDSPPSIPIREGAITLEDSHSPSQNHSAPSLIGRAGGESSSSPSIIREVIHEVVHDTIYETRIVRVPSTQSKQPTAQAEPAPATGCSMLCDDIPYDLLSSNR